MKGMTTRTYLSIGLAFLVASIVLAAAFFGLVPDRVGALREGRTALAELAAASSTGVVNPDNAPRVQAMLTFMIERNKDLRSAGVRRTDGTLVVAAGDHARVWTPLAGDRSTDEQIQVPIFANKARWGQLEVAFQPTGVPKALGMEMPWLYLAGFMLFACFTSFYFYLGRMLRHLDPSQAMPGRVRAALDTLAEGLLVIDKKQTIVLANQAFAALIGAPPESPARSAATASSAGSRPTARSSRTTPRRGPRRCARTSCSATACCTSPTAPAKLHTFMVNCSPVRGRRRQAGRRADQLRRRDAARGEQGRAAQGEGGGRGGEPGQERLPRQHEPRDPHADERDPRLHRGAQARLGQERARGAQAPRHHPLQRQAPARADQRHPRPLQGRGRAAWRSSASPASRTSSSARS